MLYSGSIKIRVIEARGLRPTEWSKRFSTQSESQGIDAYVNVDWDEYHIGRTNVRSKTCAPAWNEEFPTAEVHSGRAVGFTIFHNCVMPPDDFVANCRVQFDQLKAEALNDFWVDLEPHGQLHVAIELKGTLVQG
ncbi:unnamed protein product, partial [Mesorhabditis spiculigera]